MKAPAMAAFGDRESALRTLGLDLQSAPQEEQIKRAYHREVRKSHPDRPEGNVMRFQEVKEAYDFLAKTSSANRAGRAAHWGPVSRRGKRSPLHRKHAGTWGWVPHVDPLPVDFHQAWAAAGYNPYTGAYYGPPDPVDAARPPSPGPRAGATAAATWSPRGSTQASPSSSLGVLLAVLVAFAAALQPPRLPSVSGDSEWMHRPGIEYAIAASAAKKDTAPVLLGSPLPEAEALRQWFERPGGTLAGLGHARLPEGYLERLWLSHGKAERTQAVAEALRAALLEPKAFGPQPRFKRIVAVVHESRVAELVAHLQAQSALSFSVPIFDKVHGRPVLRLERPRTGQCVLLVGAADDEDRVADGLPQLRQAMDRVAPEVVLFDLSTPAWQQFKEEFSLWTGTELRLGLQVLGPADLHHFKPPQWTYG